MFKKLQEYLALRNLDFLKLDNVECLLIMTAGAS